MAVDYSRYVGNPTDKIVDNTLSTLRTILPSQEEQLKREYLKRQLAASDLAMKEKEREFSDLERLRSRLEGARGGYIYTEPGKVGPMPPGQESEISQLMPQQQPASRSQLAEIYRDEAMRGNQSAIQGVSSVINLDEQIAKMQIDPEKAQQFAMGKQLIADVSAALKGGNSQAAQMVLDQYKQYMPDNPMVAGMTLDKFGVTGDGMPVVRLADPETGELIGYNILTAKGLEFHKVEPPAVDREALMDKQFQQQKELQDRSFAQQMRMQWARGGSGGGGGAPQASRPSKPMPTAALKMQQGEIDAIQGAASMNANLDKFYNQIESGALNLGVARNLLNRGRNIVGASTPESRNLESFRATLEKIRNDSLRLNKGVQTEGDAQRAWNELVANINDEEVVKQRLREIRELNDMAVTLRQENLGRIRENYGRGELPLAPRERPATSGPPAAPPASARGTRQGDDFLRKKGLK